MLHLRSDLTRSLRTWVSQLAASVGATLIATMIYAAFSKPVLPEGPAPGPELTSGGKFAARAAVPVAYDGLDVMPLPQESRLVRPTATVPASAAVPQRVLWDVAVPFASTLHDPAPAPAARAPHPSRAAVRGEARRAVSEPVPRLVAAVEPTTTVQHGDETGGAEGLILPKILPTVLSGARQVWSFTASTGGSLLARVVPQIP